MTERGPDGRAAAEAEVRGTVQGVGFRPFVHRTALELGLAGWVGNEGGLVRMRVEGEPRALEAFRSALEERPPPLARVEEVAWTPCGPSGLAGFRVVDSRAGGSTRLPVPPDVAPCRACLAELADPDDRRYRHPFITCTDCGPRYTILEALPYDRERTTMAPFEPCPACAAEYAEPADRRHHAQTVCCHDCGPALWSEEVVGGVGGGTDRPPPSAGEGAPAPRPPADEVLARARAVLLSGGTVALRGAGGFHLAADAGDQGAVAVLRRRKQRDAKPFAVMVRDVAAAHALVEVGEDAARLLTSSARPVVILPRRPDARLADAVAPGLDTVGVLLPPTPLHELLAEAVARPLVMTSANPGGLPIVADNPEARARLGPLADLLVLHDRDVASPCDDSVVRPLGGSRPPVTVRRARGYAPDALGLPVAAPVPLLAVGAHLKNTFTLARAEAAWTSPHVGDLENLETVERAQRLRERLEVLTGIRPGVVVRDAHPGYLSTRLARETGLPEVVVQHHHAHAAAVLAEHGETRAALAVAFDGTGYGEDGRVWGGEWLVADLVGSRRVARLRYAPLPGGEAAVRAPWRSALGWVHVEPELAGPLRTAFEGVPQPEIAAAASQAAAGLNAPEASSVGRLFDAAAAALGVRRRSGYEGQAPMELEALAGRRAPGFALPVPRISGAGADGEAVVDPVPLLAALGERASAGGDRADLAAAFHDAWAAATVALCRHLCEAEGLERVALGGGVFQNARLASAVLDGLQAAGLRPLAPRRLPPNDGSISYGQAAVAAARLARERGG